MAETSPATIRIDKWLWQARFFKSRSLAAKAVIDGRVRVNSDRVEKPARTVAPGDVLTFAQGPRVRVVRMLSPGTRRGPADEAATLYEDLTPPEPVPSSQGPRPTKKDRRAIDGLKAPPPLE